MSEHVVVRLTAEERSQLEALTRTGSAPARVQTRARILLLADRSQGQARPVREVSAALLCSPTTVVTVRRQFAQGGLGAALYEEARPGAMPKITGDVEAQTTLLAYSDPPEGQARWTVRLLAERVVELGYVESISHVAVWERLKKTRSSPGK
jgi:hypothetical protein